MVKKIFACVSIVFFASLFLACSNDPDDIKPKDEPLNLVYIDFDWAQIDEGRIFAWGNTDGFFPSAGHPYGFDRHPSPKAGAKEDSVVHVSVLNNDYGEVIAKINQNPLDLTDPSNYFICDPEPSYGAYHTIASFGYSNGGHSFTPIAPDSAKYAFTASGSVKKAALCKASEMGTKILQELHINPYDWKEYSFYAYILGDSTIDSARHQLLRSENFWNQFDKTFRQAVARHDTLFGEFARDDRGYILTKAEGEYSGRYSFHDDCGSDSISSVSKVMNGIKFGTIDIDHKRVIIQVGYPTRRFWPLKADTTSGNIQICGPQDSVSRFKLKLEPLPGCQNAPEASVSRDEARGVWKLKYSDGVEVVADINSIADPDCVVFADTALGNYVGEVSNGRSAAAVTWAANSAYPYSIAVEPWLGGSDTTARIAIHELGHTMGLVDLYNNDKNSNGAENNLMGYNMNYRLRNRGMAPPNNNQHYLSCLIHYRDADKCLERQWDCLHNNNYDFCVGPYLDPYHKGSRLY